MSATIIAFPSRKLDSERLDLTAQSLAAAIPVPASDPELDLLLKIGGKLLDNLNDFQAIDCWLARVDARDNRTI